MMTKSRARAPGGLSTHLARTDTNEHVALGHTRDITADLDSAMVELAMRGATARGRKNLFHVIGNPEPGTTMSEAHWVGYWATFEHEYKLGLQPFVEVRHAKKGRDHRHRIYSLVRDDGRLIETRKNYRRNELVSRLTEIAAGHPLRQGKFSGWIVRELEHRNGTVPPQLAGLERSEQHARLGQHEQQQGERKPLIVDPRKFKATVYMLWANADGDWQKFASALDAARITVARGRSALLVVDETSEFQLPLARLLREEAKRANKPIGIKSVDLERVFARAKPLDEEIGAVRERSPRRSSGESVKEGEKSKAAAPPSTVANELSRRMTAQMTLHLAGERRRRLRLDENRRRKLAKRRPALDAQLLAIADAVCLPAAAHLVRCLRDGRLALRTAVHMIGAMALVNGLAPLLLAAAAVSVARSVQIASERDAIRADVDQAKAARSSFSFADVPNNSRVSYAALLRSAVFEAEGPEAEALIVGLGRDKAAAFVAWWAHASDRQRAVVQSWDSQQAVDRQSGSQDESATSEQTKGQNAQPDRRRPPKRSLSGNSRPTNSSQTKRSATRER